jgi:type I restriction enzyme, S subunit
MSEWKTYKLEDAIEKLIDYRGKTPSKTQSGIPLVTAKVIKNGRIEKPNEFIAEEDYESWMRRGIPKYGDVVLTTEAPLGEVAQILTNEKIALAQRVITLRGKTGLIDNSFLKYFLVSPVGQNNLKAKETGSTVTGIKQSELRKVEILAPDLPTQKEIAQILTSLDDKIEINQQMNQTLEAMAQAIFKEWFVNFNFPGFDGELVDGLPKGWRKDNLGEEFNLIMGQSPPGTSYNENGEGMVFYQGRTDFGFRFPTNRLYTTEPKRIAKPLDTLVSVRAPVGDINMANEICCVGRGLSSVRHKSNAYSFTYYMMKSLEPVFNGFEGEGTVFGSINKSNFESIEILIPSEDIISEFETVINPIDNKILENTKQIQSLTQIRETLLPKLMSGQLELAV